jgi:SpoVK/Ycf46/Vps4 family AAA+-type ATPase
MAEQFEKFRSGTNGGVIFCGQPGWGMIRSLLAQVLAIDTSRDFICINGADMLSMSESAGNVRKVFDFARAYRASKKPCVLFIEDLDAICGRSAAKDQFLMELDSAFRSRSCDVFVIASSNKHHVDPELLRPGRLDLQVLVDWTNKARFDRTQTTYNFQNRLQYTPIDRDLDFYTLAKCYHESCVITQKGVAIICLQAAKFAIIEHLSKLFAPGASHQTEYDERGYFPYLARRHFEQCKHKGHQIDFRKMFREKRQIMEEHCALKSLAENYPQFVPYQEEIWPVFKAADVSPPVPFIGPMNKPDDDAEHMYD